MAGTTPNRWAVRSLVVLTALLCLGTAGYAGQAWWARRQAHDLVDGYEGPGWLCIALEMTAPGGRRDAYSAVWFGNRIAEWRSKPWYGTWRQFFGWCPRRTFYEALRLLTAQDFGNDPDAWEAWFKAHPDLVWDDKLKRLVDKPQLRYPPPDGAP